MSSCKIYLDDIQNFLVTTCKYGVFCRQLWDSGMNPCPTTAALFSWLQNFHLQLLTTDWCEFLPLKLWFFNYSKHHYYHQIFILFSFVVCQILYQVGKENEAFKQFRSLLRKYPQVCQCCVCQLFCPLWVC